MAEPAESNMMRVVTHDGHWLCWARECRMGVHLGYPSQEPYHTPARRAKESTGDSPPKPFTEQDEVLVGLISVAVSILKRSGDDRDGRLLEEWWGAYPDAPDDRRIRLRRCMAVTGVSERRTLEVIKSARQWVEAWVCGAYCTA